MSGAVRSTVVKQLLDSAGTSSCAGHIDTVSMLRELVAARPGHLSPSQQDSLHRLCREVCVRRMVLTTYDAQWRRVEGSTPLSETPSGLLIAVLLVHAEATDGIDQRARATALKCLNAALVALDVFEPASGHVELEQWAENALEKAIFGGAS